MITVIINDLVLAKTNQNHADINKKDNPRLDNGIK